MGSDDKCWLKPEQLEAIRAAARDGRHTLRNDALIALLYDTGLWRAELSQVDRAMVDLEDGDLRIPTRIQKDFPNDQSPDPATFELAPAGALGTVEVIECCLDVRDDESPALFPSQKGERMIPKGINDVVQRAARRAEIRPYSYEGNASRSISQRRCTTFSTSLRTSQTLPTDASTARNSRKITHSTI